MDLRVTRACSDDVAEILEFWRTTGPQRQFFPAYRREHLISERGLLRGLAVEDLLLARERRGGEIVGTLGLWDQGAFRRWRVHRLPRALAVGALFINSVARLGGGLPLPRKGEALPQRIVTALCVADDDAGVLQALWGEAVRRIARDGGAWLTVGLHELDPLLPWVRQRRPRELFSRLYLVHWPDGREAADAIDAGRCPYVELGGL
jgi:hypothetical protein